MVPRREASAVVAALTPACSRGLSLVRAVALGLALSGCVGAAEGGGEPDSDLGWIDIAAFDGADVGTAGDAAAAAGDADTAGSGKDAATGDAGTGDVPTGDGDAGAIDAVAPAPIAVVINEVESNGDDRIELLAVGGEKGVSIDLGGWSVHDSGYDPADAQGTADQRYVLAAGSALAAGERLVLVKGAQHGFGLGKADALWLVDAAGKVRDATSWSEGTAEPSWCRIPDGAGAFATCSDGTFGEVNTP